MLHVLHLQDTPSPAYDGDFVLGILNEKSCYWSTIMTMHPAG